MNDERRKRLRELVAKLADVELELEVLRDEEQEARDNLPENLEQSERAERMDEVVSQLDEAADTTDSVKSLIEEAMA